MHHQMKFESRLLVLPLTALWCLDAPLATKASSSGAPWTHKTGEGTKIGPGGAISKVSRGKEAKGSLLFTAATDRTSTEDEDLYVTKRDGRRELIDKKKVRKKSIAIS